ncbi:MAG: hypothetical protein RBS73_03845 [Prolixibacteraceae bacterium]|nr:hypothetical protein [Prolixibacteraceae bacterium]
MFTFGILSSHIPYVAFVVFYLVCLLFPSRLQPVELPSPGEEKISLAEISAVEQAAHDWVFSFQSDAETREQQSDLSPGYHTIIKIPLRNSSQRTGICFFPSLFSRPPPVL